MFMYLHSMTTHLSALIAPLNTNNSDNTNIFLAHGGAERNFDFWMLNVELLRLAAMWNWPMMNFDALTRCFEHEIFEHGYHHEFFWTRIFWGLTDLTHSSAFIQSSARKPWGCSRWWRHIGLGCWRRDGGLSWCERHSLLLLSKDLLWLGTCRLW